ncbi:MAG: methionine aminotransferase [Flavobacteriaceae bacterium]|nr:methionine aminotransferase [Flavobacteriaceae bacterium]
MIHSSKLPHITTTIFTTMSAMAQEHQAINLSQGFPNFKSDPKLIDLVSKAMNDGYNQYAPMQGILPLRKAIASKFQMLYNTSFHPETEITITSGATQAIFTAITAFVKENDEVIIFRPAYDCYAPTIELNGGKTVSIQLKAPHYKVNWEEVSKKINPRTKMIIINSPQNPSGTIFSYNDMIELQKITSKTNIIILSDEVYEHIIFDGEQHQSICLFSDLKSRSLIVASFGKTFHNTGWKIGYACAPRDLMDEFKKVHQFNVFSVNHPMQIALAEYLNNSENYNALPSFYQKKRDLFLKLIKESRFHFVPSKGTYFQSLGYSNISDLSDMDFAKQLTVKNKIASIPLSVFNEHGHDDKMLRFCFAKTDDTLKKAAEILNSI